jgi:hypothetical protein
MSAAYVQIPVWVYEGLEQGEIDIDEYLVLTALYRWANRSADNNHLPKNFPRFSGFWRIDSYSAERLCKFLGLDASDAHLKQFRRAERSLEKRKIIKDDYRLGDHRPYHVWVPSLEVTVSLCPARVPEAVPEFVPDEGESNRCVGESCEDSASNDVRESVPEFGRSVSPKDQYAAKAAQPEEREPSQPPLQGGFSPSAPSRGNAQPAGAAQTPLGFDDKPPQRKTLNSRQCDDLNILANAFTTLWARYHRGFSGKLSDVKKLLRECSPLEVLIAYRAMAVDPSTAEFEFKDLPTSRQAVFFDRGAEIAVRTNRDNHVQFCLAYCPHPDWDFEVPKFYGLEEKWCAIFERPLPFVYWLTHNDIPHFYHPHLHDVLDPWKAALDAVARRAEETRKANEKAAAEKKRKDEIALEQARINWMRDARDHVKDDDLGLRWLGLNSLDVPKEWETTLIPFLAELKILRKAEEDRRTLDPVIRFLEEKIRTSSEPVLWVIEDAGKKGFSADQIQKAAQVMGLQAQIIVGSQFGNDPCWGPLPKNYKSPLCQ